MTDLQENSSPSPKKRAKQTKYAFPLVEVLWLDAVTHNEWTYIEDITDAVAPSLTITVAFLLKEDDTAYYMASTYHEDQSNAQITVPKGMVKSFRVIKKPSK